MEVEVGAVEVFHVGGEDVEVDADVFAVGEGYGDDGIGLLVSTRGWGDEGELVAL